MLRASTANALGVMLSTQGFRCVLAASIELSALAQTDPVAAHCPAVLLGVAAYNRWQGDTLLLPFFVVPSCPRRWLSRARTAHQGTPFHACDSLDF